MFLQSCFCNTVFGNFLCAYVKYQHLVGLSLCAMDFYKTWVTYHCVTCDLYTTMKVFITYVFWCIINALYITFNVRSLHVPILVSGPFLISWCPGVPLLMIHSPKLHSTRNICIPQLQFYIHVRHNFIKEASGALFLRKVTENWSIFMETNHNDTITIVISHCALFGCKRSNTLATR